MEDNKIKKAHEKSETLKINDLLQQSCLILSHPASRHSKKSWCFGRQKLKLGCWKHNLTERDWETWLENQFRWEKEEDLTREKNFMSVVAASNYFVSSICWLFLASFLPSARSLYVAAHNKSHGASLMLLSGCAGWIFRVWSISKQLVRVIPSTSILLSDSWG